MGVPRGRSEDNLFTDHGWHAFRTRPAPEEGIRGDRVAPSGESRRSSLPTAAEWLCRPGAVDTGSPCLSQLLPGSMHAR